jgi:hypothetical protein
MLNSLIVIAISEIGVLVTSTVPAASPLPYSKGVLLLIATILITTLYTSSNLYILYQTPEHLVASGDL